MTPTARPTSSEAIRRCHSICSWNDVMTPTTGEAMPTMALADVVEVDGRAHGPVGGVNHGESAGDTVASRERMNRLLASASTSGT